MAAVLALESVGEDGAGDDFGIQIRARTKAVQTFTVQTADGHYRYLPTERSLAGSAYGAVPESLEFGPQGGRELVEETVKLIESLWCTPV